MQKVPFYDAKEHRLFCKSELILQLEILSCCVGKDTVPFLFYFFMSFVVINRWFRDDV